MIAGFFPDYVVRRHWRLKWRISQQQEYIDDKHRASGLPVVGLVISYPTA